MVEFARLREQMVEVQIAARGVRDPRVLGAMRRVPREHYVPAACRAHAYADRALAIGPAQAISQPYTVALMAAAADIAAGDRVLEVGTGSGYAAAVLGAMAARVLSIEIDGELADAARARLAALGVGNVEVRTGDGASGWPDAAPFDAILVTARADAVPPALQAQLREGGRLVLPVGAKGNERLVKLTRRGEADFSQEDLGAFSFVPLVRGERPAKDRHERSGPA